MDLSSYLLKPVQRVGKYALLLSEISKECPETHPDYADLKVSGIPYIAVSVLACITGSCSHKDSVVCVTVVKCIRLVIVMCCCL